MRSAVVEEAGCLAGLVDLLDSSKQEMETREWAAAALCCLSWAEEHRLRIASTQHAVPRLIALVRSALRKSVEGAVRAAAGTLSNLALSPELVQLLLGSGAVSCLVACMKSSSPAVRTSGAHALKVSTRSSQVVVPSCLPLGMSRLEGTFKADKLAAMECWCVCWLPWFSLPRVFDAPFGGWTCRLWPWMRRLALRLWTPARSRP